MATVAQIVHLEANELEWLASHLGHNLDVHKEFYRLQDTTVELAKVSRLLMAVDMGKGKDLCGKRLKDINLNGAYLCCKVFSDLSVFLGIAGLYIFI